MIEAQSLAESLWQDSRKEILQALHHPFVRQLGDGTLPRFILCFYSCTDICCAVQSSSHLQLLGPGTVESSAFALRCT